MSSARHNDAYLGKRLQDLLNLAHQQMAEVYNANGLAIPVEGSSTLRELAPGASKSLVEIARALGQSHQLAAQRIAKLEALELLEKRPDPDDGRRTLFALTASGEEQWRLLDALMEQGARVNRAVFEEVGSDLNAALDGMISALHTRSYAERFESEAK